MTSGASQDDFGDYRILEWIGAGPIAEVFRARDTHKGRTVAIKVITSDHADDPAARQALEKECAIALNLGHRHSATLYGWGEHNGRPYLVYDFVAGQTLGALLAGQPLNARRAIEFAIQISDALAEAHAHGLTHRMLRPDKLLVSLNGTAKIIDFGLGGYAVAATRRAGGAPFAMTYWAPED
jgi:serine/threonine protein kinase